MHEKPNSCEKIGELDTPWDTVSNGSVDMLERTEEQRMVVHGAVAQPSRACV